MIILASTSPRRKEILGRYFTDFIAVKPQINEEDFKCNDVSKYALELSKMKAYSVSKDYKNDVIISCDTIVVCNNKIFEKPKSRDEAIEMLKILSNNKHFVLSAYTILYKENIEINQTVKTYVYFNNLTEKQITDWLDLNIYLDKAGAYAIQEDKLNFVHHIEGSYNNVVGFPIESILEKLKSLNIKPN